MTKCPTCRGHGWIWAYSEFLADMGLKQICPECNGPGVLPAVSHKEDPQTSKDAERQHTNSGKRQKNIEQVLKAVRAHPGLTATEHTCEGVASGEDFLTLTEVRRRLSDLKKRRLIYNEGRRGSESLWYPEKEGV